MSANLSYSLLKPSNLYATANTKPRKVMVVLLAAAVVFLLMTLHRLPAANIGGLTPVVPDASQLQPQAQPQSETALASHEWPCMATNSCRFAYAYYVTRSEYMCASLINAHQMRTRKLTIPTMPIIFLHTPNLEITPEQRQRAQELNVTLREVPRMPSHGGSYDDVLVKLRIWQMVDFDRIIYMDADMQVLRSLDHLFLLPKTELAIPRAYWFNNPVLTSILMVITPSEETFQRMMTKYIPDGKPQPGVFDMDLINNEYLTKALVLNNIYGLLDWPFAKNETIHFPEYDLDTLLHKEAYLVHFSAIHKPWHHGSSVDAIKNLAPNAHPTFLEFRRGWWQLAHDVCGWPIDN